MTRQPQRFRSRTCPYPLSIARAILACAIVPNLPFWIACAFLPIQTTLNLDYLPVALAALFLRRTYTLLLLAAAFVLQVLTTWLTFYFYTESDAVFSARYLPDLPWLRIASLASLLVLSALAVALLTEAAAGARWKNCRLPSALGIAAVLVTLLTAVALTSDTMERSLWRSDRHWPKLISSTAVHLIRATFFPKPGENYRFSGGRVPSATAAYLKTPQPPAPSPSRPPNLVLVLVESYGLTADPSLRELMTAPYLRRAVTSRYSVRFGHVPYMGPTISGEFRELCGLQLPASALRNVSSFAGQCLPRRLASLGYRTSAFHGYLGRMYDRDTWWKQIGFEQVHFYTDLSVQPEAAMCQGVFPGICDADVAHSIRQTLLSAPRDQPQFVHWVTLNSHLPIPPSMHTPDRFHCGQSSALIQDADLCRWAGLISLVNEAVAQLAADPALPPTDFVIVGDHAPPYISADHRKLFSYSDVSAIYLTSKP